MITTSNRLNDTPGYVPPVNLGVYTAKSLFSQHLPYVVRGSVYDTLTVTFNYHFLKMLRRAFAGTTAMTQFSPEENTVYVNYQKWVGGESLGAEMDGIMVALDKWLVVEILGEQHVAFYRDTTMDTPWN
jgi:hypothetical protein